MFRRLHSLLNSVETEGKTSDNPLSDASTKINVENPKPHSAKTAAPVVKTFYLIDFENTGLRGLDVIENINPATERISVFSTEKAPNIPTATVAKIIEILKLNLAAFEIHEVPVKSQSVDMHLVSYLGYLVGIHGTTSEYVILSNDTDYDNIVKDWKTRENIDIKRQGRPATTKKSSETTAVEQSETVAPKPEEPHETSVKSACSPAEIDWNIITQNAVRSAGYTGEYPGKVASIVCKSRKEVDFCQKVHEKLDAAFPKEKKLQEVVESFVKRTLEIRSDYSYKAPRTPTKTKSLQHIATLILADSKIDEGTIKEAVVIISEFYDKIDAKSALYGALTSKFKQAKGRNVYNLLKDLL